MSYITPLNREQYMLPECLEETISPDNPVRIIDIIVDEIVNSNKEIFYTEKQTEVGRPEYHPYTLLKLYLYGYFNWISSSRKLEKETKRNIEVKWLLGNLSPDHWTISNYRKKNTDQIKTATKLFRRFLKDNRYIESETVAIDGVKIKANASKEMLSESKIQKRLAGLEGKMEDYLNRIGEADKEEDIIEEYEKSGEDAIQEHLIKKVIKLQDQIEKLKKAKEELEIKGKGTISPTDLECNLMKSRDGKIPAYNVQMTVDKKHHMIADSEVTTEEYDNHQLGPMIKSYEDEIGIKPKEVLLDGGYNTPDIIEKVIKEEKVECYVPNLNNKRDKEVITFTYEKDKDEVICSEGKRLPLYQKNKKKHNSYANMYRGIECEGCSKGKKCKKSKNGRTYYRYENQEWRDKFQDKMREYASQRKIKQRKNIIEHVFGTIKTMMGKIPLLLRGKEKVSSEINIYTTVYNLKRLIDIVKIENIETIIEMIRSYKWRLA